MYDIATENVNTNIIAQLTFIPIPFSKAVVMQEYMNIIKPKKIHLDTHKADLVMPNIFIYSFSPSSFSCTIAESSLDMPHDCIRTTLMEKIYSNISDTALPPYPFDAIWIPRINPRTK